MARDIQRINTYEDSRFSQRVLFQHGAFAVDGDPYEAEIVDRNTAVVRGGDPTNYPAVIELFRFYSGHINRFLDQTGRLIQEFPEKNIFHVRLETFQPSQFYIDQEKLAAVKTFIRSPEDIIIPVTPWEGRYISQDGHTRLAAAVELSFDKVYAFISENETVDWIQKFACEAQRRKVFTPFDFIKVSHQAYDDLWNRFCDDFMNQATAAIEGAG